MTLLLAGGGLFLASCSDDDNGENDGPSGGSTPFASVTAKDGSSTMTATVNDTDKTIKFGEFQNTTDLTAVEVTFKMNKGHILKTPANLTSTVNLNNPVNVVVLMNGKTEETYKMTADTPETPEAILGAKVGDVEAAVGEDKSITVKWQEGMEINHMVFTLDLVEGATVKSPENLTFDLEFGDGTLVVNYQGSDITYTVKATDYVDPMPALGWTDVTTEFAPLPAYIKVYKTTKAGGIDNNVAYVAMMGSQATMAIVGDGTNPKTIDEYETNGEYKVYVVGVNSTVQNIIIQAGKVVRSDANSHVTGAIYRDADGNYGAAYVRGIEDKLYSFPFRASGEYEEPKAAEGKAWAPQTAVNGVHMILFDNNVLTADQVKSNESTCFNYGDDNFYAHSAIGVTKYNKVFAFCGQMVEGSKGVTIPSMAQSLKDMGCVSAIAFEASGSPDMHINKKKTVINKYAQQGKPKVVQCAVAFK